MKPEYIDDLGLDVRIKDMEETYIDCRVQRHDWQELPCIVTDMNKSAGRPRAVMLRHECRRCGTQRQEEMAFPSGQILRYASYKYPDGYLVKDTSLHGSITRDDFRVAHYVTRQPAIFGLNGKTKKAAKKAT